MSLTGNKKIDNCQKAHTEYCTPTDKKNSLSNVARSKLEIISLAITTIHNGFRGGGKFTTKNLKDEGKVGMA